MFLGLSYIYHHQNPNQLDLSRVWVRETEALSLSSFTFAKNTEIVVEPSLIRPRNIIQFVVVIDESAAFISLHTACVTISIVLQSCRGHQSITIIIAKALFTIVVRCVRRRQ